MVKEVVHHRAEGALKQDLIFIKGLNELADLLERIPIPSCQEFFNDSMMPRENIRTFLSTVMAEERLQKIGRFYADSLVSHGNTTEGSSSGSSYGDNYRTFPR